MWGAVSLQSSYPKTRGENVMNTWSPPYQAPDHGLTWHCNGLTPWYCGHWGTWWLHWSEKHHHWVSTSSTSPAAQWRGGWPWSAWWQGQLWGCDQKRSQCSWQYPGAAETWHWSLVTPVLVQWDVCRACQDHQVTTVCQVHLVTIVTGIRSWPGWTLLWTHPILELNMVFIWFSI